MIEPPRARLKSRKPFWVVGEALYSAGTSMDDRWRDLWKTSPAVNKTLVMDPTLTPPGFDLPRRYWCAINRIRTLQGRCAALLYKWGLKGSPLCQCGEVQTIDHIVNECPLLFYQEGIRGIHRATPDAVNWIAKLDITL